jgi:23S rRNA (cytidine1920-2'-O)/16S rRNA (cytidine1409-2'-O)-methyltransferase
MAAKERADRLLVRRGLFESRKRAQDAIAAGLVTADGVRVGKPSDALSLDAAVSAAAPHPFVSRGGVKLEAGLAAFGFAPEGKVCLDVGASTGGFSDVLVRRGAARVYAVDVGHGQLHRSLLTEPRIVSLEGTDARSLAPGHFAAPPELIVCDVSFISLKLVLPCVLALAAAAASLVCLIKPQFEAGRAHLAKGIVRDPAVRVAVCDDIATFVEGLGWRVVGVVGSPIAGGDGNREFLLGAVRR